MNRKLSGIGVMIKSLGLGLGLLGLAVPAASAKVITIKIGIQDMCTDTYAGGTAMQGLGMLEKYLPTTGNYAGDTYKVVWQNYSSGGPITQMMMAGKLDFGVMGDYPLIVNGARFQATQNERSYLIAMTDYNMSGAGNAIVVPTNSPITNVKQLEGKNISVPIGSAAWGMLFEMAADNHIPMSSLHLVNQDPMLGITSIATGKIDAHADFCPVSEFMEYKNYGRVIYSGNSTGVPYLHGVVVTGTFAQKYPEIVTAYVKALIATERWIAADPYKASAAMAQWSMIPKQVLYLYFSKGGYLTPDPSFNALWIKTLQYDHGILQQYANIPPLDFASWVKPQYMQAAYTQMGMNYQAASMAKPFIAKVNASMPPELWVQGQGISKYKSINAMFAAMKMADKSGRVVEASYVYDHLSGMKLFGNYAYYVEGPNGALLAYLSQDEADAHAQGGKVLTFAQATGAV
ncbi:MAG TPA: ABC transporter substrate-binding protein [Acetobacteraceae bacterium]|nr:ABC transporter substrate-binding protein [Acetobacteraceae bacterium]